MNPDRGCLFLFQNIYRPDVIYTEGCIQAGETWFQKNLIPVASVAVSIAVLQVCEHSRCLLFLR